MSLRAFHLFFIAVSVALSAFFAAWAASQYRAEHEVVYAFAGVGAVAACGALIAYGAAFQRKTRHLLVLLIVLGAPRAAHARDALSVSRNFCLHVRVAVLHRVRARRPTDLRITTLPPTPNGGLKSFLIFDF